MSAIESMKESYNAMGCRERLAFLSGVKGILELEMQRIGEKYDRAASKEVRIRLLQETSRLQNAIHVAKDDLKESMKNPAVVQGDFWDFLEQYCRSEGD